MSKIITKGIDLSYCQQNVDFEKVKKAGYKFAILKLGNARDTGLTIDERFEEHYKGATKAGLGVGIYVYSLVTKAEKATMCAKQTISYIKNKTINYPVYFDIEFEDFNLKCGKKINTDLFKAFLSEIERNKYYAGVYTCPGFVDGYLNDDELKRYDHWIAQYNETCSYPGSYGMWQCSVAGHPEWDSQNIGSVPGVSGQCDVNYAYYDYPTRILNYGCNNLKPTNLKNNSKNNGKTETNITFKVGDKVKLKTGATTYDGGKLALFTFLHTYNVMQVGTSTKKDYICIGKNGVITAAVKASNLKKV